MQNICECIYSTYNLYIFCIHFTYFLMCRKHTEIHTGRIHRIYVKIHVIYFHRVGSDCKIFQDNLS